MARQVVLLLPAAEWRPLQRLCRCGRCRRHSRLLQPAAGLASVSSTLRLARICPRRRTPRRESRPPAALVVAAGRVAARAAGQVMLAVSASGCLLGRALTELALAVWVAGLLVVAWI